MFAASLEENERKVALQDIHEAYQLLLKIVKAKNIFSEKLSKVKNEKEAVKIVKIRKRCCSHCVQGCEFIQKKTLILIFAKLSVAGWL